MTDGKSLNIDPKGFKMEGLPPELQGMKVESIQVTPGKEPETIEEWKVEVEELKVLLRQSNTNFKLIKEHLIATRAQVAIFKEALEEVDPENELFDDEDYDDEDK